MIVDSSAIAAIVLEEPQSAELRRAFETRVSRISASTLLEIRVVMSGRVGSAGVRSVEVLLQQYDTEVVPFDKAQADVASAAYRDYGRGSGHPARLNFGDCFAYALAYVHDEPLLYVGDDFARTDIRSALEELDE